ncbi:hypothetical protein [Methanobacterium sp. MBAC-LM]|uniref:hypothetical protein n=1 Tax=Methanobacterium sp. MBAC-LM TaxID=3412034 RepID=UPI003C71111D
MLTEFFGNYPRVRVIDLLLSHPYTEYTKKDMAECSSVARGTLYEFFDKLTEYKLIKPTRKIGNTQLYSIDIDSPAVKALNAFQNILAAADISGESGEPYEKVENLNELFKDIDNIFEDKMRSRQTNSAYDSLSIDPESCPVQFRKRK